MYLSLITIPFYALLFFVFVFLVAVAKKNNGLVDIAWGLGFVLIATISYFSSDYSLSRLLIVILVTLWGIRLATHIYLRSRGKGEDFRYHKWREEWGNNWVLRSFFQIYLLQWLLMQLVAFPIYLGIFAHTKSFGLVGMVGVAIWLIGFFFESVGDYQLTVFKRREDSHGQLMTTGLWRYTRHPNYFGEATLWWGVALLAFEQSDNFFVFIGPLVIDFLLLYVSGIPLLEQKYQGRADWEEYAKRTSAFFPLPPRSRI